MHFRRTLLVFVLYVFSANARHPDLVPDLVAVKEKIPSVILDIKYATSDNFTRKAVYNSPGCFLRRPVVEALAKAALEFEKRGYRIKIWDAYRPRAVQYKFWELVPDSRYVADPNKGSKHNRGAAVDLTLVDREGKELPMGTGFDDFSEKAHVDFNKLSKEAIANRKLLRSVMENHGFKVLATEWWHFDYRDWEQFELLDIPFEEIAQS